MANLTFRELHGIERDPRWPHVDGCTGGCVGCLLEDAVLAAAGTSGRDFLFENMPRVTKAPPTPVEKPKSRKAK